MNRKNPPKPLNETHPLSIYYERQRIFRISLPVGRKSKEQKETEITRKIQIYMKVGRNRKYAFLQIVFEM